MRSKTRIDATALYVCHEAFGGTEANGGMFVVHEGEELRGSHPAVQRAPDHFSPHGTPKSEWPNPFHKAIEADRKHAAEAPPPPPEIVDPVECVAGFDVRISGKHRHYTTGSLYPRADAGVRAHPEHFRIPARPLV